MTLSFEKPLGTKDLLPEKLTTLKNILDSSKNLIVKWGYEEVETPIIEYHQTIGLSSQIDDDRLIKFLDSTGKTVILRPDFTTPAARFAATIYKDVQLPIRLMYQGYVFRNKGNQGFEAINQLGIELIGVKSLEADAEVITLAVKTIKNCLKSNFKVSIGHSEFLKVLFKEIGCSLDIREKLYQYLLNHDYVGYKNLVNNTNIIQEYKEYLLSVTKLRGDFSEIIAAQNWFFTPEWEKIFLEIKELWEILKQYKIEDYISYDLSRVGRQNYYTGLIYNVYCVGCPEPICVGGRYDNLLASFGRSAPATGFAINIDSLINVILRDEKETIEQEKTLIIFSRKKRLTAFKVAEELRDKGEVVILAEENTITPSYKEYFSKIIEITVR